MKIVRADVLPFRLPLRRPLATGQGIVHERRGLVLRLVADCGLVGFGEASPAWWIGEESLAEARRSLDSVTRTASASVEAAELRALHAAGRLTMAAACALDTALLDLEARRRGVALTELLGGDPSTPVSISALLGARPPHELAAEAAVAARAGYRCVKLKVGGVRVGEDVARVDAVRRAVGAGVAIRLDANRAWSLEEARRALGAVAELGVALVEEPLREPRAEELRSLRAATGVALALDESIPPRGPLPAAAAAVDAVVLKPARLGGITPCLSLAREARAAGLRVVVTDSIESAIGAHAALHLAAALPPPALAVGLGGAHLLAQGAGTLAVPEVTIRGPGLGVILEDGRRAEAGDA